MQFKYAVAGGYGAWRIRPRYVADDSFDQELVLEGVPNPLTVYFDPLCQDPCKRDQNQCVIATRISTDRYKAEYGDQKWTSLSVANDGSGWFSDKEVRIAEYWKKSYQEKVIALLSNGEVADWSQSLEDELAALNAQDPRLPVVEKKRKTRVCQIKWWKVDGAHILEGPIAYDWKFIPVVKLPGRYVNIEGEQKTQSLVRHSRDAQRVYNYDRTTMSEAIANTPRAPFVLTPTHIKGFEKQWAEANSKNRPYLLANPDPEAGGMPQRQAPPDVPQALIALAAQDQDDIKATTGYFDAGLGREADRRETEGQTINRARRGDLGSYEFVDNLSKAIRYTGEILVDMIPKVYDSERIIRILGPDGTEDYVTINGEDQKRGKSFKLGDAKYDVKVDIGPAYATARQEALSTLLEASQALPIVGEVGADLIIRNLDVPGGDDLHERIRQRLIQQGIIQPKEEDMKDMPPPPPPDPVQQALVAESQAKAQSNQARAMKDMAEAQKAAQKAGAELETLIEELIGKKLDNLLKEKELRTPPDKVTLSESA